MRMSSAIARRARMPRAGSRGSGTSRGRSLRAGRARRTAALRPLSRDGGSRGGTEAAPAAAAGAAAAAAPRARSAARVRSGVGARRRHRGKRSRAARFRRLGGGLAEGLGFRDHVAETLQALVGQAAAGRTRRGACARGRLAGRRASSARTACLQRRAAPGSGLRSSAARARAPWRARPACRAVPAARSAPCGTASASTLRIASSSASRSRVISDSLERRRHAAQLRDQRRARPLVERAAGLAGVLLEPGDGAGDERIVVGHRGRYAHSQRPVNHAPRSRKDCRIRIVSSRSGLVDSKATGQPINSSIRRTYLIACAGRSAQERAPAVLSFQPSMVS